MVVENEPTPTQGASDYNPEILQDLLPIYYKRLFPHLPFYRWVSYGLSENSIFVNREFSFTLKDDVYIRYLSFENQSEFEKELCERIPVKIDLGAVMTIRPKNHRLANMRPVQRELVFDIDLTDYDEVRTCCAEANCCTKCWKFMVIACRMIDTTLREDFGFEHLLWVFSGRRGIHCWACDKIARHLNHKGRSAIAEYLQLHISGADGFPSRVSLSADKMHHSIKRALRIIQPMFEEVILSDQNVFGTQMGKKKLLFMISDDNVRNDVELKIRDVNNDSKKVWEIFTTHISGLRGQGMVSRKLANVVEEIQLALLYPRLDINVSKGINHLLKSPFCIHPKTGKVCTPLNPNAVAKFDPTTVPTITQLLNEINEFDFKTQSTQSNEQPAERSRIKDYKKTGMFKGITVFEEFLRKLELTFKIDRTHPMEF